MRFHFDKDNEFYDRNYCVCQKSVCFHFDKDSEFYVSNQCVCVRNECVSTLTKIMIFLSEISASLSEIIAFPL